MGAVPEAGPADRYRKLRQLGEGGSARVWLVEDRLRPGPRLALKEPLDRGPAAAGALRREYVRLARLRHPGLPEALELESGAGPAPVRFTLEYVRGRTLAAAVAAEGPQRLVELAVEALRVLAFLHDFGLVHRDLKPANILVRDRPRQGWRVVLLDLGLAAASPADGERAAAAGTVPYLAPELLEGGASDRRSDLYALGAVLWEAVHGASPVPSGDGEIDGLLDDLRRRRAEPHRLPPGFPPGVGAWLEALLDPDPAGRPAGAPEALARLNAASGSSFPVETAGSRAARLASDPVPGRGGEMARLTALLAPGGPVRLVWLAGAAGSGKTRLLRALGHEATLRGWRVLAPPPGDGLQPEAPSGELDGGGPGTLLLADDVQAASGRLLGLLDRLVRSQAPAPLRVAAAVHPGEVRHPALRRLLDDTDTVPTLDRVELRPLELDAVRAMAERAAGRAALSETRLRWLLDTSEGNPALVETLLVEDVWATGRRGRRPAALERSLSSRLGRLSAPARRWLAALAALGQAPDPLVARLAELDPDATAEAAEEVRGAGLARLHRGRWAPESRAVARRVLEALARSRRRELHRRAAALLERDGDDDLGRLARLWGEAGRGERAAEVAARAAGRALDEGDPSGAADLLAFAVDQLPPDSPDRAELLGRRAGALTSAGRHAEAATTFARAVAGCGADDPRHGDLLARQAHALAQTGRFEAAEAAAAEALERAAGPRREVQRALARRALALVRGRLGREAEALPLFEQALASFREAGDTLREAETLHGLAAAKDRLDRADARTDFEAAVALYRRLGHHGSELKSLVGLAGARIRAGGLDEGETLLEQVRQRAVQHGHLDLVETALSKLASLAIDQGRYDRAIALGQEALAQASRLGDANRALVARCRLAEALIGCGRPAQAVDVLRHPIPFERVEPDNADSARMLLAKALVEASGASAPDAAGLLAAARDGFDRRGKRRGALMALVIELERRAGDPAVAPFEPLWLDYSTRLAAGPPVAPEIRVRAGLARGCERLAAGDHLAAREPLEEAAEAADTAGVPVWAARCRAALARCLDAAGDRRRAGEVLEHGAADLRRAAERIGDPAVRRSFLDHPAHRPLGQASPGPEGRLDALYEMIRQLNSETDPEALLGSILDMALRAVDAERGMILLADRSGDGFSVRLARDLESETASDAEGFSRTIVARAGAGRSILALDTGRDERFRDLRSVNLYGIRSLMCVPLRSRGRIVGTVYLDSRRQGRLFDRQDLRFVEAFADHAALALENARERAELVNENRRLQRLAETRVRFGNIVGRSAAMQGVFELIEKVADSDVPVLIQGDSGTGKELVARAIHLHGRRRRRPFLSENCAAIPDSLLESELFGHVRGAFTGAERDRRGMFEQADGGTLFLDEVGDMPAGMQARLLRALQEGEVRRVGGDRPLRVDVRVLAATHRDLDAEVRAGRFREDLLYRLRVVPIRLPALRERPEDVPPLVDHLLERIARERGRPSYRLEPDVVEALQRHPWPGNVRQLHNVLQRLTLLAPGPSIDAAALAADPALRELVGEGPARFSLDDGVREQLRRALEAAGGDRRKAARLLGVSRATVYRKIKQLGL